MNDLKKSFDKLLNGEIKKSWIYLIYIYLLLPALLFGLSWLLRSTAMAATFGMLFHNYGLFVASTIPGQSLTGIAGIVIFAVLLFKAVRRRDWLDVGLCVLITALNTGYYALGINYMLLPFITLT